MNSSVYGLLVCIVFFLSNQLQRVHDFGGSPWVWGITSDTRYIYSGMLCIQERSGLNAPEVSYTRGSDLSGRLDGTGGIGGLLARSHGYSAGSWSTHNFYHADGNGNITAMVNSSQSLVASYKYDPYGNLFSSSGTLAAANLYRFSSKLWCASAGLYYYGYRFYDPSLQRWLNRDPIGEAGGLNLYGMVSNDPVSYVDTRGFGKFGLMMRVGKWGTKKIADLTKDEAKRRYKKEGADICASKSQIKKFGKKKGCKKPKIERHGDESGQGSPHGHPPDRKTHGGGKGGHGFIGFLSGFTAVGAFGDSYAAQAIDLFNPISDVVDIANLFSDDEGIEGEGCEDMEGCEEACESE